MNPKKPSRRRLLASCADPTPDDGQDPREWKRGDAPTRAGRKALQLCRQAAEALNQALGDCRDEVLTGLVVVGVTPAPHAGRLLVTVAAGPSAEPVAAEVVLERLGRAAGRLRTEVATAVNRRRAPELAFRVAVREG